MTDYVVPCRVCGSPVDQRRNKALQTCVRHRWARRDVVLVDRVTPYEEDVAAQLFVAAFPGGATLEAVALAMGISRERVRQIEERALTSVRVSGVARCDDEEVEEWKPRGRGRGFYPTGRTGGRRVAEEE